MTTTVPKNIKAFPLQWPVGVKRNKQTVASKFEASAANSWNLLIGEIQRFDGQRVVISTNVPLIKDGDRIMLDREPVDPGVAVYFIREGRQMVFASDKWDVVRDNIRAIAKTIEALRGIERWGSSDMLERAVEGFAALPASTASRHWSEVLALPRASCNLAMVEIRYKELARSANQEHGPNAEAVLYGLNNARDEARKELSQ